MLQRVAACTAKRCVVLPRPVLLTGGLQCVAACCSVLLCVQPNIVIGTSPCATHRCVALCCSVLQCVAVRCSVYSKTWSFGTSPCIACRCVVVCCSVLQCVAVCCSMLQCAAKHGHWYLALWSLQVCSGALQCVAVWPLVPALCYSHVGIELKNTPCCGIINVKRTLYGGSNVNKAL